jgi:hypothetical protein
MAETSRVQRWREGKRQHGLKAVTIWLTTEEELRLKDLALQWHCSPSVVMQQALAQVTRQSPQENSSPPDTLPIQELLQEQIATLQAEVSAMQAGLTTTQGEVALLQGREATVTATLAQDLPALVRQQVEGLALEALGMPVTDTGNGDMTEIGEEESVTDTYNGDVPDTETPTQSVTDIGNGVVTDTGAPAPAVQAPAQPVTDTSNGSVTDMIPQETAPAAPRIGENKLTGRQMKAMLAKRQRGASIKDLMEEYSVSKATVHRYLKEAQASSSSQPQALAPARERATGRARRATHA